MVIPVEPDRELTRCDVCGEDRLRPVLDLGQHPLCDDLVPIGDDRVCREHRIEILLCGTCLTAHQRFHVAKQELFPSTYHYRARFTVDVLSGMADLVASTERTFGTLTGEVVLDIGCNDGSLLDIFRSRGAKTVGIEPTDAFREAAEKGHAVFGEYLSDRVADAVLAAHGTPSVITFTNVFAHISGLEDVIRSVGRLMGPHTAVVIENHYVGSVLDRAQFDTFYHEHARTYSLTSFTHVSRALGVTLVKVEFPARYGGNIRVFFRAGEAPATVELDTALERERDIPVRFHELRKKVERWRDRKARTISALVKVEGPLRAKAFPGRAAILVRLLGLDERHIRAVYEKPGSLKIGHYLPGTRIPILSDDDLFALPDQGRPLLNLAWHIGDEIRGYLRQHGYHGRVIDVLEAEDLE
jgi:hypothetical protein